MKSTLKIHIVLSTIVFTILFLAYLIIGDYPLKLYVAYSILPAITFVNVGFPIFKKQVQKFLNKQESEDMFALMKE